uniref:SAYSvFN domain-containing protein 1 n=1 Tax=Petromyzon marinus TaxID=7757 RepID=A0AAJ7TAX9_PETMA|nr:SAYSvFN domain-containing protein 1 [Petromyzon marinus]
MSRGPDSVERRLAEYRRRKRDPGTMGSPAQREGPAGGPPHAAAAAPAGAGHNSWLRRLLPPWGHGTPQRAETPRGEKEQPQGGDPLRGEGVPADGAAGGEVGGDGVGRGASPRWAAWLRVSIWLLLLGLFLHLQLLTPFLLVSVLIFLPLASSRRARGTLSAYSVFNPGCRPLLGAITTEQLEREMGYGAL